MIKPFKTEFKKLLSHLSPRQIVLSIVESAFNYLLGARILKNADSLALLDSWGHFNDKNIRLTFDFPNISIYIRFHESGIKLSLESSQAIDARVSMPFGLFLNYFLDAHELSPSEHYDVRVRGDSRFVDEACLMLQSFDVIESCLGFVRSKLEMLDLSSLWQVFEQNDAVLLKELDELQSLYAELKIQMNSYESMLLKQTQMLESIESTLKKQQKIAQTNAVIGFSIILIAVLINQGSELMSINWKLDIFSLLLFVVGVWIAFPKAVALFQSKNKNGSN